MVRRGSTVRVRQRALQKPRIERFFFRKDLQVLQREAGMEPFVKPSGRTPQGRSCQIGALSSAASPAQQWRPSSYCNSSRTRLTRRVRKLGRADLQGKSSAPPGVARVKVDAP